jgi:hypothetical protein
VGGDDPPVAAARTVLCRWFLGLWIRSEYKFAIAWFRSLPLLEQEVNREPMRDCLERLAHSTWFEWDDGSRLMFWHWPGSWLEEARDGARARVRKRPPRRLKWLAIRQEDWALELDAVKLSKLITRRYLEPGPVNSTVPRFPVPKGDCDIRVVWDLTKNRVNESVCPPSFFLLGFSSLVLRVPTGA